MEVKTKRNVKSYIMNKWHSWGSRGFERRMQKRSLDSQASPSFLWDCSASFCQDRAILLDVTSRSHKLSSSDNRNVLSYSSGGNGGVIKVGFFWELWGRTFQSLLLASGSLLAILSTPSLVEASSWSPSLSSQCILLVCVSLCPNFHFSYGY